MAISSPGIGSGLDIAGMVSSLVAAERAPTEQRLGQQEARLQAKLSAYGSLKGGLSTFRDTAAKLKSLASFQAFSTKSSDTDALAVTGSTSAAIGSYSVEISNLAQSHSLASAAFASKTDAVGTGTLAFRFGTYDADLNTFTANADKATQSLTIDGSNNSLEGIRDAVNAADFGVTATVVKDASGHKLVFKSSETGEATSLEVTVSGDGSGTDTDTLGLSALAFDPTALAGAGKNMIQTREALNASLTVDGLSISSATNRVTDVIEGVTLDLKSATTGTPVTVTVERDTTAITTSVNNFVSAYNSLVGVFDSLASYDAESRKAGPLLGDSVLRSASSQIRTLLTSAVSGLGGSYRSLADVGISLQSDGKLALDKTKFGDALAADSDSVARLFSAAATPSDSLVKYSGSTSFTQSGTYGLTIDQLATQATYSGAAGGAFPLTIDADNDTFGIKVDGVQASTISLTQKSYATAEELAAEIQSQINADSKLADSGVSVLVAYVTDHFEITSAKYGSASKVQVTSVDTNTTASLGFAIAAETTGQDVAGSVGSQAGTGLGKYLTGGGSADGLKLEITGGGTGDRGTVVFTRGIADQLDTLLEQFLGENNAIKARTDGLSSRIEDIGEQRTRLNDRMVRLEARYRAQFTALDSLLAQLGSTAGYLASQLGSLPGVVRN